MILGLRLRSAEPTPVATAGWNWPLVIPAGFAGLAALVLVANRPGQAIKRRRDPPTVAR
jgi:tellurite resistance protein TehA-like permease